MLIEKFDAAADEAATGALFDVYAAGAPVDEAGGPIMSRRVWCGLIERGWCAEPREGRSWADTRWSCPTGRTSTGPG
jgi:hypothetical protein